MNNIDPVWLQQQFQAGMSPVLVANQIRTGQAPAPPPQQIAVQLPGQRGVFSTGVYFCAHLMLWNGWVIISAAVLIIALLIVGTFAVGASSAADSRVKETWQWYTVSAQMFVYVIPILLAVAAFGAIFVVGGSYVRKNIDQFE